MAKVINRKQAKTLRRYTNLVSLMDILRHERLTLLNPSSWDDQNDKTFIKMFVDKSNYNSALALCLTDTNQTYHHWKIFSGGYDAVCIHFNQEKLLRYVKKSNKGIIAKKVTYKANDDLKNMTIDANDLPFLKRSAYRDEKEFRLLYPSMEENPILLHVPINLDCIRTIYLSPWMPQNLSETVKEQLTSLGGLPKARVKLSLIRESKAWIDRVGRKIKV